MTLQKGEKFILNNYFTCKPENTFRAPAEEIKLDLTFVPWKRRLTYFSE